MRRVSLVKSWTTLSEEDQASLIAQPSGQDAGDCVARNLHCPSFVVETAGREPSRRALSLRSVIRAPLPLIFQNLSRSMRIGWSTDGHTVFYPSKILYKILYKITWNVRKNILNYNIWIIFYEIFYGGYWQWMLNC